jgi:hypothetical protein
VVWHGAASSLATAKCVDLAKVEEIARRINTRTRGTIWANELAFVDTAMGQSLAQLNVNR